MLNITVDLYSGRPNPTFTLSDQETRDILKEVALHKGVITSSDVSGSNLGYRGINISSQSENILHYYGLPPSFNIANRLSMFESKGREIAERLLKSPSIMSASYLDDYSISSPLTNWILKEIKDIPINSFPKYELENERIGCQYEQVAFAPHFWNTNYHVKRNNCYNFATNRGTDSFAQLGRASGQLYREVTCYEVTKGAIADGLHKADSCFQESEKPRLLIALFIAPGPVFIDYHWYRQCSDGNWAHKLGPTPVRNTDNSNYIITDPHTANRGPYFQFCGYMLAPKSMKII
ncbi:hypothetical protein COL36_10335 [Bacillus wiedmannii]|uniref:hypothetical protein n=1 Tax=Bacillus wiedmannii TaxID=1890302 RepID=UPI000BF6EE02|nr:hypothetical protein [Bacillus wiedmannii]PFX61599.1 hypothetical protein COL36_10335 [Bacillus wiedmannii]